MTTRRLFLSLIPAAPLAWLFAKPAEAQEGRPRFHITLSPNAKIIQAAVEKVARKYREKIDELERMDAEHRAANNGIRLKGGWEVCDWRLRRTVPGGQVHGIITRWKSFGDMPESDKPFSWNIGFRPEFSREYTPGPVDGAATLEEALAAAEDAIPAFLKSLESRSE